MNETVRYNEKTKLYFLYSYGILFVVFGVFFGGLNGIEDLLNNFITIVKSPDYLITDYIDIAGRGAAFINSGLLVILLTTFVYFMGLEITGITLASIFTVSGFGFFGKNIFNLWFTILGVFLFSLYKKQSFNKYFYIAIFGTSLSPVVTQIAFFSPIGSVASIVTGIIISIFLGFILAPLATYLLSVHKGFNLYNVGFTTGMIGTFLMSIFRAYGYEIPERNHLSSGNNLLFSMFFTIIFFSFIIFGLYMNNFSLKGYGTFLKNSGRLVTDYVILEGFPLALINMGFVGLIGLYTILLCGSEINGPSIAGILTMAGFAAFGKNIKNIIPVMFGAFIGGMTNVHSISNTTIIISVLFSTTLAPIAGEFGPFWGIIAGFLHSNLVLNIGYLHGGLSLYNNGFSGGLVAAFLLPLIEAFKKEEE